jgi:putative acetyltransferase
MMMASKGDVIFISTLHRRRLQRRSGGRAQAQRPVEENRTTGELGQHRVTTMLVRHERTGDEEAIHGLTLAAFAPMPFSDGTEAQIISALRRSGDLVLSLVAEEDGTIIGHIAFSPATIGGVHDGWFGLGPVSVPPGRPRRGDGKPLIRKGLNLLRQNGASGCALIGNPDIYRRVGFVSDGQLSYRDLDRRYVQRIFFSGPAPRGELRFAAAFEDGSAA